jgi:hypothetical protein
LSVVCARRLHPASRAAHEEEPPAAPPK